MINSVLKKMLVVSIIMASYFTTHSHACLVSSRGIRGVFRMLEQNGGIADIKINPVVTRPDMRIIDYSLDVLSANALSSFKVSPILGRAQFLTPDVCSFSLFRVLESGDRSDSFSQPLAFTTVRPFAFQNTEILILEPQSSRCSFDVVRNAHVGECGLQGVMIKQ